MPDRNQTPLGGMRAWFIWALSALAFGYAFFQRVAPSVLVSDLMAEFAVSGAVLGSLSALYFYPYVILQAPVGALLDRFGARLLLTVSVSIAAVGSIMFASAASLEQAYVARFLVGTGSAVGLIGSLALASRWFPPHRFAFLAGGAMFFAMICAIAAQAPLASQVVAHGWRLPMTVAGVFAAALAVLIAVFVRNAPPGQALDTKHKDTSWKNIGRELKRAFANRQVWQVSLISTSLTAALLCFAGLWGVPFLEVTYGLSRSSAAFHVSFMLMGWAIGAPLSGWLSDHLGKRRPMILGSICGNCFFLCILIFVPGLSLWAITAVIFLSGACGAGVVVSYALVRELTPSTIHGSVIGVVNGFTVISAVVLQPLVGKLLDAQWDGRLVDGARLFQPAQYRLAFICLLAWSAIGFIGGLAIRETYCRSTSD